VNATPNETDRTGGFAVNDVEWALGGKEREGLIGAAKLLWISPWQPRMVVARIDVVPMCTVSFFLEMGFWMTSRHDLDVMPGSHEPSGQRPRVILHAADVVAGNGDDADPHGPRMLAETAVPTRGPERTRRRVVVVDEWGLRGLRTAVFELAWQQRKEDGVLPRPIDHVVRPEGAFTPKAAALGHSLRRRILRRRRELEPHDAGLAQRPARYKLHCARRAPPAASFRQEPVAQLDSARVAVLGDGEAQALAANIADRERGARPGAYKLPASIEILLRPRLQECEPPPDLRITGRPLDRVEVAPVDQAELDNAVAQDRLPRGERHP
jgi:hypothetical protein